MSRDEPACPPSLGAGALVLAGYASLVLAIAFPVIFDLSGVVLGEPQVDVHCHLWDMWWSWRALSGQAVSFSHSDYIYYPAGISVWRFFAGPLLFVFSSAIYSLLRDLTATYNATMLFSLLCSCAGGYLLGVRVLRSRAAAFLVGAAVAFNPLVLSQVKDGLPEFVNLGWAMLFFRSLVVMSERRDLRSVLLSCAWYAVATLWCWYIGALLVLLAGLYLLVFTRPARLLTDQGRYALLLLIWAAVIFGMVLLASRVTGVGTVGPRIKRAEQSLERGMADNQEAVDISVPHFLYQHARRLGIEDMDSVESFEIKLLTSLDPIAALHAADPADLAAKLNPRRWLVTLLLALLAMVLAKNRLVLLYAAVFLFTSAVALGPCLVLGGEVQWGSCGSTPYSLLGRIVPGLDRIQFPRRLLLIGLLVLALAAGHGLLVLLQRLPRRRAQYWGPVLAGVLSVAVVGSGTELNGYPLPSATLPVPDFYIHLSGSTDDFAILDVPFTYGSMVTAHGAGPRYAFYQTVHGKRKYGGAVPLYLADPKHPPEIANNPLLRSLRSLADGERITTPAGALQEGADALRRHRFRYIIMHSSDLRPEAAREIGALLRQLCGEPSKDESVDGDILSIFSLVRGGKR